MAHPRSIPALLFRGLGQWRRFSRENYETGKLPEKVHAHGFDIYLHSQQESALPYSLSGLGEISLFRDFEPETTALFGKILRKGMTVVDVGASIGWFSLFSAKTVGQRGRIIAFEPEPRSYERFEKSIVANGFRNIIPIRSCVTDYDGTAKLYISNEELGRHSIVLSASTKYIEAKTCTLDSRLRLLDVNYIDVLKVDTEGAEPLVLKWANRLIQRGSCPNIVMEWNAFAWKGFENFLREILQRYDAFKNNRSPFLLKKLNEQQIWDERTWVNGGRNLYLRIKERSSIPSNC
jgi:FkbM family methyltransferase